MKKGVAGPKVTRPGFDTPNTSPTRDTERQTAPGKVPWHFTMSLDGFVAGPNHSLDWMTGVTVRPGLIDEYVETTGAVLGGRDGFGAYPEVSSVYGGAWHGPLFVLTHHPEDAQPADGIRLFDHPGGVPVRLELLNSDDASAAVNLRYRPVSVCKGVLTNFAPLQPSSRTLQHTRASGRRREVGRTRVAIPASAAIPRATDENRADQPALPPLPTNRHFRPRTHRRRQACCRSRS